MATRDRGVVHNVSGLWKPGAWRRLGAATRRMSVGDTRYALRMIGVTPVSPYGSARDLPSLREIETQITAFRWLGGFLPASRRRQLEELREQHRRIVRLVDSFYGLLGPRNWVYTDDLNMTAIEQVVDCVDPETAESRLLEYYGGDGRVSFQLRRLNRFEAMRPRMDLLERALDDFKAGRYYSTVFVLLSVMDGFVNDLDKNQRQGLHARSVEDMVAWNSVVGHHLGLSHAHKSFLKSFRRTDTSEVTELFRNGIMHGTLVNFDNQVVATKAWNRLFAVADWADARNRQAEPVEASPSLRESLSSLRRSQKRRMRIQEWQPYEYEPNPAIEEPSEVAIVCADFLERWRKQQWAYVGSHFMQFGSSRLSVGKRAALAKDLYASLNLVSFRLHKVRHVAAAVAEIDVELMVDDRLHRTQLRWVRVDDAGETATEWEDGHWVLAPYGPPKGLQPTLKRHIEASSGKKPLNP